MTIEKKKRLNAVAKVATLSDQITKLIDEIQNIQNIWAIYNGNDIHYWSIEDAREQFAILACLIGHEEDDEDVEVEEDE